MHHSQLAERAPVPGENEEKAPDSEALGNELLNRLRETAHKIVERVSKVLDKYPLEDEDKQPPADSLPS